MIQPPEPPAADDADDLPYRALLEGMYDGVTVRTRDGRFVFANEGASRILGLSPAQLAGREPPPPGWRVVDAETAEPRILRIGEEVLRTGRSLIGQVAVVHKPDGQRTWVSLSCALAADHLITTIADVTHEGESHERKLIAARLQALGRRVNEIELLMRLDGRLLHANDRAVAAYGYSREELLRMRVQDLRARPTVPYVPEQLAHAATDEGMRFETIHRRKDGTEFPVGVSSRLVEADGDRYLHSLVRDLTEERAAEARLRAALRRNEQLVEELQRSLEQVKTLTGLLPICMYCKKIRDDAGYWERLESYLSTRTGALFSHGICPDCFAERWKAE